MTPPGREMVGGGRGTDIGFAWSTQLGMDCAGPPMELRKDNRYRLSAPVFLFWAPQNGSSQGSQGVTRTSSTTVEYVNTNETPAVKELVQMDLLFPNPAPGEPEIHLTAEGVVFRV